MEKKEDKYGRTLKRLLHELSWAVSNRNAYNELCRIAPYTSWGFFTYASVALKNDMISHVIKVLDCHKDAASFQYILKCEQQLVSEEVKNAGLSFLEIYALSEKLRVVRDKTHFHIDKAKVFSPESVWKSADIKGDAFNKVVDGLWRALNSLYRRHFEKDFLQPIYDAKDIEPLLKTAKENHVLI